MGRVVQCLVAILTILALGGCGGDDGSTTVEDGPASLAVTVVWPARTRGMPSTAGSLRLAVRQGDTTVLARVLNRPDAGGTLNEVLTPVPVGEVTVAATAFAERDAAGAVVATASAGTTAEAGVCRLVTLDLRSTIARIAMVPGRVTLRPGETADLAATALDGDMTPVPVGALAWSSSNPAVATVSEGAVVALAVGEAEIAVTDPESGVSGVARVSVESAPGRIAFLSNRDGNDEVYVMNADGSDQRRLTTTSAREDEPSISPDGRRVAYISNRGGRYQVFVINTDGSGERQLTNEAYDDWGPSFSRDGRTIYYFRSFDGQDEVMAMSADGGNVRRLTNNGVMDVLPTSTPSGDYVLYSSRPGAVYQIWRMRADGGGAAPIITANRDCWYQSISPDGGRIAYTSGSFTGASGIAVANIDGSGVQSLTSPQGYADWRPAFSPDGGALAFASNRDGAWAIYTMSADGGAATRITGTGNWYPSWGE